ncbi:hypothetical protein [Flavobacterium poyangense]|uniref:hypothetical protein n=1 Tax=Flavobacterium poyangense TaxID=2204302 RepID=UPI00141EF17B|nr:hypothetical protein [Flavobacterium sp. JXAS1]
MRKFIYIILFIISFVVQAQTKESDYFVFYKDGSKHLKPIKYVLFNELNENKKNEDGNKTYFYIGDQTFIFNSSKNKINHYSLDYLKKIKLEDPYTLTEKEYNYFKEKIIELNKTEKRVIPNSMPISSTHDYFKVYILEKTIDNKIIRYEVDWKYSMF